MAEVIRKPDAPTILRFQVYETKARANTDYYEQEGTHLDTGYRIWKGKSSINIVDGTLGFGTRVFSIGALNLTVGELYTLRVRWKNETDWSFWSYPYRAILEASDFVLPPNIAKGEPLNAAAQPLPFVPDFIGQASLQRDVIDHRLQTGQRWRRLKHTAARYSARMKWVGLTISERNTLVSFLEARLDAAEPFETNDFVHGARRWFTRRGSIQYEKLAPPFYGVQIEADQSKAVRFWTVGLSDVGGPDPII